MNELIFVLKGLYLKIYINMKIELTYNMRNKK